MKKFNFSEVEMTDLLDNKMVGDVARTLGNHVYKTVADLRDLESDMLAQRIFAGGEIELTENDVQLLTDILNGPNCPIIAIAKRSILNSIMK